MIGKFLNQNATREKVVQLAAFEQSQLNKHLRSLILYFLVKAYPFDYDSARGCVSDRSQDPRPPAESMLSPPRGGPDGAGMW